jgi:hypothetical protein
MIGERTPWSVRILRAAVTAVLNIALWIVVPYFFYGRLSGLEGSSNSVSGLGTLSPDYIYTFGAIITGLEVIGALTAGSAVSVPFISGGYLASAYYVYSIVSGGSFAVAASGLQFSFSFEPLLYLLMLPSLFSAIKQPITFLLEQTESGRAASDEV